MERKNKKDISTRQIIEYLKNPDFEQEIKINILNAYEKLERMKRNKKEEINMLINSLQLNNPPIKEKSITLKNKNTDLSDLIVFAEKLYYTSLKEAKKEYDLLNDKLASYYRFRDIFIHLNKDERLLLTRMYTDGVKWEFLEYEFFISHSTLVNRRKKALNKIKKLYAEE